MQFRNEQDQITYASFLSIAKNGYAWKSPAQRAFWLKATNLQVSTPTELETAVGAKTGQYVLQLDGYYKWAEYGARAVIPCIFAFVYDADGVVRIVRINGNGNLRDGWKPNYSKLNLMFERQPDFVAPTWEIPQAESTARGLSQPVGAVGDKIEVKGVVVYQNSTFTTINYTNVASYFIIIKGEDGNVYQYRGSTFFDKGQQVHFRATVKEHKAGKQVGETVTVVKAPKAI